MNKEAPLALNTQVLDRQSSRRQFLKVAAATSGALLLSQIVGTDQKETHAQTQPVGEQARTPNQTPPNGEPAAVQPINEQEPSLLNTAKETAIFTAGNATLHTVAEAIGLPITKGSQKNKQMVREKPAQLLAEAVVVVPPIEEALCRLVPNLLLNDSSSSNRWEVGILTSLAFAYLHNFQDNERPNKYKFIWDKFPLSAFLAGGYFWRTIRQRGYEHAVVAHATGNAAIIFTRRLLYEFFPKLEQPNQGWSVDPDRKR